MRQVQRASSLAAQTGGGATSPAPADHLAVTAVKQASRPRAVYWTRMRTLLASLAILGALGAESAFANRWDQQQQQPQRPSYFAADRGERRQLFQRRQVEPPPPAREAPRFETPQSAPPANLASPANAPQARLQPGEAGRRAQQQYGGRVLSVAPADSGYHVRLLRDGEVSVVTVPNQ